MTTGKQSTHALVQRARQGEREAFDELLEANRPALLYVIRSRLGELLRRDADVDDIYQETALRGFGSIGNFEFRDDDSFFRWITSIAMHVLRDLVRRRQRRPRGELTDRADSGVDSPSKGPRREERFSRLEEALQTLSDEHRQVVTLAWLRGLKIDAVAERMNRSPGAVRKLLLRALGKLRGAFGDTESLRLPERSLLDCEDSEDAHRD